MKEKCFPPAAGNQRTRRAYVSRLREGGRTVGSGVVSSIIED